MIINYHGRKFRGVVNSPDGQVNAETVFQYFQNGDTLTAKYYGGSIREGHLLGKVQEDNSVHFVYHHLDTDGHLMAGICTSKPEILPDGNIRLHESWEWTFGGSGHGQSIVEEIN